MTNEELFNHESQDELIDVPDIPMPTIGEADIVADEFAGAVKLCIVGAGQGGSRIAETFWKLGYRRVCIINTAQQDMTQIKIPDTNKYLLPGSGAGKDPDVAEKVIKTHYEDVLDFLRRGFKEDYDRVLICIGAGGGTGAGMMTTLVDICHELNISLGIEKSVEDKKVGVLIALPTNAEGIKVAHNTLKTIRWAFKSVKDKLITPLIVLDNQRIKDIYPGLSVDKFWSTSNSSICSLFHLFNTIACKDSKYTTFDKTDFTTILEGGAITFGAMPLLNWKDPTDVSFAIRDNLRRNILAGGMDLREGNIAGCIVIGSPNVLSQVPQENLEHGFEQLSRILSEGSTVHRGIYQGKKEGIAVYTVIGGLTKPIERIDELNRIAGFPDNDIYKLNQ